MKRDEYLKDQDVSAFIEWAAKLVSGEWGLEHSWSSNDPQGRNPRQFDCQSLYEACESYYWNGGSFEGMAARFDEFRRELKEATDADPATDEDKDSFLKAADSIAKWGGINNLKSLTNMGRGALEKLNANAERLDPKNTDTDNLRGFKYMNSSFTKIYSAMIDDFPIYDSRVGCALTSLIKQFCKERRYNGVPALLSFGVPPGRGDAGESRNPSDGFYEFPNIRGAQYTRHADSNLKAAWILGKLAEIEDGDFSKVPKNRRVRALEAALFMIGYQPLGKKAVRKS